MTQQTANPQKIASETAALEAVALDAVALEAAVSETAALSEAHFRAPDSRAAGLPGRRFGHLWGWPLALAFITLTGLTAALFSEGGLGDWLAAVCLAAPVLVCVWFGWLRQRLARKARQRADRAG